MDKIEKINEAMKKLETARIIHSEQWEIAMSMPSWSECEDYIEPYAEKVAEASREYRFLQIPVMSEIGSKEHGDRMSLKDFIENCNSGGFIDYDGYGTYIRGFKQSDINIYPSDVENGKTRTDFAEVMWYNR